MMRPIISIMIFVFSIGCLEKEFDPADPAGSFAIAKVPYEDEHWEIAIKRLGEYKSRFPYSKYAIEAELLIANAYWEQDKFAEAALAYEQFAKLHPRHPKVDFAMYRIGLSYWEEAPDDVDREQDFTGRAIEEWQKLVAAHPRSSYAAKARKLIRAGVRRKAENLEFIASFYCKQEIYHSCAFRYLQLAKTYEQFPKLRQEALERAAEAFVVLAEQLEDTDDRDANIYFRDFTPAQLRAKAAQLVKRAQSIRAARPIRDGKAQRG